MFSKRLVPFIDQLIARGSISTIAGAQFYNLFVLYDTGGERTLMLSSINAPLGGLEQAMERLYSTHEYVGDMPMGFGGTQLPVFRRRVVEF